MMPKDATDERRLVKRLIPVFVALTCVGALVVAIAWLFSSDNSARSRFTIPPDSQSAPTDSPTTVALVLTTVPGIGPTTDVLATAGVPTTVAATSPPSATSSAASTSGTAVPPTAALPATAGSPSASAPASTSGPAAATGTEGNAAAPVSTTAPAAPISAQAGLSYPTNADGTPQPLLLVYDTNTITLVGMVPSQAAKDRLEALALANSQSTTAAIVDQLTINGDVPIGIGVRVIELNSQRFASGSAKIQPAQGNEITRVATAMQALPKVTVVVVGHADQQGATAANIVISSQRARAVVDFLVTLGVDATRLSDRAAGASDLLTLDNDPAGLALNRRTEFIFYGLLVA